MEVAVQQVAARAGGQDDPLDPAARRVDIQVPFDHGLDRAVGAGAHRRQRLGADGAPRLRRHVRVSGGVQALAPLGQAGAFAAGQGDRPEGVRRLHGSYAPEEIDSGSSRGWSASGRQPSSVITKDRSSDTVHGGHVRRPDGRLQVQHHASFQRQVRGPADEVVLDAQPGVGDDDRVVAHLQPDAVAVRRAVQAGGRQGLPHRLRRRGGGPARCQVLGAGGERVAHRRLPPPAGIVRRTEGDGVAGVREPGAQPAAVVEVHGAALGQAVVGLGRQAEAGGTAGEVVEVGAVLGQLHPVQVGELAPARPHAGHGHGLRGGVLRGLGGALAAGRSATPPSPCGRGAAGWCSRRHGGRRRPAPPRCRRPAIRARRRRGPRPPAGPAGPRSASRGAGGRRPRPPSRTRPAGRRGAASSDPQTTIRWALLSLALAAISAETSRVTSPSEVRRTSACCRSEEAPGRIMYSRNRGSIQLR